MSREQWGHGYHKGFKDGLVGNVSFVDYCKIMYETDDSPQGDITRDILSDKTFPTNATKWLTCAYYLRGRGACKEAVLAACELWFEWKRFCETKKRRNI